MMDGTSNTVLLGERYLPLDGEHALTAVQHASHPGSGGEDSRGLWQINLETKHCGPNVIENDPYYAVTPDEGDLRKGGWISDVTYSDVTCEASPGGTIVAMETLTIAHEGLLL
jgi:hypothetical protein